MPLPCRIHLSDARGEPVRPLGLPFWRDHFVCTGAVSLPVAPGQYHWQIERGPEWSRAVGSVAVGDGESRTATATLRRIADLRSEGWWSGETHVHRAIADVELLMRAEDLHVAQVITWWNKSNPWTNTPVPAAPLVKFDGHRFYHVLGGEDERDGGALLYFDLTNAPDITTGARHFPSSLVFAQRARAGSGVWLDAEKPFWWDFPMWLAHGMADTVGIANNHLHHGGALDSEAWGRPRDIAVFAGPQGNGRYTQSIYYHALNGGLHLPPSAGSASGVLPNPVGYNRAYVHVDGEFTYEKWREGLRAGRSFVSNGPLLRARANREWPGHVFKSERPLEIRLEARVDSSDPIAAIELVHNGDITRIRLPHRFKMLESGWFLLRAVAVVTNTFRFASTAPWYVEIGGQTMKPRAASAQFFVDWSRERMTRINSLSEISGDQKEQLLAPWRATEAFWIAKVTNIPPAIVTGRVLDASTGRPVAARLYIQNEHGRHFFAESAATKGSAVRYNKQSGFNKGAIERHTALSAHPFRVALPAGRYTFTAERGKEYFPEQKTVEVGDHPVEVALRLRRFVNMAARDWFSGDTHVHRAPAELQTVALAEDLNVVLPMTGWTIDDNVPPSRSRRSIPGDFAPSPMVVDKTHVIYPLNTEYEIFNTAGRSHTLGALLIVNHREPFDLPALPWRRLAERARAQGALIDFEKHNWEWSAAIAPILQPALYELANNHLWRTEYGVTNWGVPAPDWMNLGTGGRNERAWALYGFQAYYALLNCGFRPRPTAGTAHGVHPVPLGYGRVYVHLPEGFSYGAWIRGLETGRSFVTTGPMLLAEVEGKPPGHQFTWKSSAPQALDVTARIIAPDVGGAKVEIVVNGQVVGVQTLSSKAGLHPTERTIRERVTIPESGWLVIRCWTQPEGEKARFAHTAPWWFSLGGTSPRPQRREVEWLANRVRGEISRNRPLLSAELLREYEQALAFYETLLRDAH